MTDSGAVSGIGLPPRRVGKAVWITKVPPDRGCDGRGAVRGRRVGRVEVADGPAASAAGLVADAYTDQVHDGDGEVLEDGDADASADLSMVRGVAHA